MSSTPPVAGERSDLLIVLRECLANGQTKCWEEFIRLAQPILASAVLRSLNRWNASDALADDLIQESFVKLFNKNCHVLRAYRGNDSASLTLYLRVITRSAVADCLNREPKISAVPEYSEEALGALGEDVGFQQAEKGFLLESVERCLCQEKPRDRRIFWLKHRHGYRPREIAAFPGIHLGQDGVETVLDRLMKVVRKCLKSREGVGA